MLSAILIATAAYSGLYWNFENDPANDVPAGWSGRGGKVSDTYRVAIDIEGHRYLAARSHGSNVQLGSEVGSYVSGFRSLSWSWRVRELPRGADERKRENPRQRGSRLRRLWTEATAKSHQIHVVGCRHQGRDVQASYFEPRGDRGR